MNGQDHHKEDLMSEERKTNGTNGNEEGVVLF